MDADWAMKQKFLTLYDYGTGGIWTYIRANSAKEVSAKYPKLTILEKDPDWFTDEDRQATKTVDIDDPPDAFLAEMEQR